MAMQDEYLADAAECQPMARMTRDENDRQAATKSKCGG
jgi:hypothetical protein